MSAYTIVNIAKAVAKSRPRRSARAAAPTPSGGDSLRGTPVIEGQRRANAIDSIVDHAQRGGDPRQSGYRK